MLYSCEMNSMTRLKRRDGRPQMICALDSAMTDEEKLKRSRGVGASPFWKAILASLLSLSLSLCVCVCVCVSLSLCFRDRFWASPGARVRIS